MDLREYEQNKFAIAEILRSASACVPEQRTELRVRLQDLFARLAEDRFNLVVIGRFNREILVDERNPGERPAADWYRSAHVRHHHSGLWQQRARRLEIRQQILDNEIPIAALPQHITQQGNPGNVQRIKTAEVQLPAEILRRGFYFVDTPGLGSVIVENTLTAEAFLPEADALFLVTSYESPLSEEEVRFFKAGSSSGRRIFVVLNKHDTISLEQRQVVIGFVREQLNIFFGRSTPPISQSPPLMAYSRSCRGKKRASVQAVFPSLKTN